LLSFPLFFPHVFAVRAVVPGFLSHSPPDRDKTAKYLFNSQMSRRRRGFSFSNSPILSPSFFFPSDIGRPQPPFLPFFGTRRIFSSLPGVAELFSGFDVLSRQASFFFSFLRSSARTRLFLPFLLPLPPIFNLRPASGNAAQILRLPFFWPAWKGSC